jgi:hypothetical protein
LDPFSFGYLARANRKAGTISPGRASDAPAL